MSEMDEGDSLRVVLVQDNSRRPSAVRDALDGEPGVEVIRVLSLTPGRAGLDDDQGGDRDGDSAQHDGDDPPPQPLSVREREVLALVAQALSNRQIAARLTITEGTVKRHLCNVFSKLGAVSRIDAVNKAISASFISNGRRPSP